MLLSASLYLVLANPLEICDQHLCYRPLANSSDLLAQVHTGLSQRHIVGWGPSPLLSNPLTFILINTFLVLLKMWIEYTTGLQNQSTGCKEGDAMLKSRQEIDGRRINSLKIIAWSRSLPANWSESKCYDGAKTAVHCFIWLQHVLCCHLSKCCICQHFSSFAFAAKQWAGFDDWKVGSFDALVDISLAFISWAYQM